MTAVQALRLEQQEKAAAIAAADSEAARADKLAKELQVTYPFTHILLLLVARFLELCDQGQSRAGMVYCSLINDGSLIAH